MANEISTLYEQHVREKTLKGDDAQRRLLPHLQSLHDAIVQPPAVKQTGLLASWIRPRNTPVNRSLYVWGDVGRGKSMLMDLLFYSLTTTSKQRIHFHAFMQEVHHQIHIKRHEVDTETAHEALLEKVAKGLHAKYGNLIYLDELQVTDVADAMILHKLFSVLLDAGVTFMITSNRPPNELYLGGLQREKFLAFVDLIQTRADIVRLASEQDYRLAQLKSLDTVYWCPQTPYNMGLYNAAFTAFTHNAIPKSLSIELLGRQVHVPECSNGVARFSFSDLCDQPLGAADYLAIAQHFHTVFLTSIPELQPEQRNVARRFVTLIDTLYDHNVKLLCTASVPIQQIYTAGDGTFEFARTVSRLAEMQSDQYLKREHFV